MIPWGIIIDCGSVALGGAAGAAVGRFFPKQTCEFLSRFFGISSIAIGITLIGKSSSLSPVMLSLILGGIIGEGMKMEEFLGKLPRMVKRNKAEEDKEFGERFTGVLILICSGSLGLMGAMSEGLTGDASVLITKAVLDFFGAAIFASTLGAGVAMISVPQFLIYLALFSLSGLIMPWATESMIADFMGCGGVIALMTGIRVAEIKPIRAASFLPALLFVMPVSFVWTAITGAFL